MYSKEEPQSSVPFTVTFASYKLLGGKSPRLDREEDGSMTWLLRTLAYFSVNAPWSSTASTLPTQDF